MDGQPNWYAKAECRNYNPELWHSDEAEDISQAKKHCQACPVREECLALAYQNDEQFGIWGGLTVKERRRQIRRQRREFLKIQARMRALLPDGSEPPTAA